MYTKGFWIIFASCGEVGSKVVWGKCGRGRWFSKQTHPKLSVIKVQLSSCTHEYGAQDRTAKVYYICNRYVM